MDINNALKRYSKSHLSTYHYDSFIQDNTVVFFWRLNFIEPWDIAIWENLESAFLRFNLSPTAPHMWILVLEPCLHFLIPDSRCRSWEAAYDDGLSLVPATQAWVPGSQLHPHNCYKL